MVRVTITDPEELIRVEKLSRSGNARVSRRAMMVLHSNDGIKVPQIARLLHCFPDTVRYWLHRYNEFGIEGLEDKPLPGRPRKLDDDTLKTIQEILLKSPQDFGYVQTVWTLRLIRQYLKDELRIKISKMTIRRALTRLGFHWGRPRHTVVKEDPEAQSKLEAIRSALEEVGPEDLVIFEDESDFHLLPPIRNMWMPWGIQTRVPTPGTNAKTVIFGGLDVIKGGFHYEFSDRKRSVDLMRYLEHIEDRHPQGKILVILDNSPSHKSKMVEEWLSRHERIRLLYLPSYSPQLTPIEKLWAIIKGWVAANRLYDAIIALKNAIRQCISKFRPVDFMALNQGILDWL